MVSSQKYRLEVPLLSILMENTEDKFCSIPSVPIPVYDPVNLELSPWHQPEIDKADIFLALTFGWNHNQSRADFISFVFVFILFQSHVKPQHKSLQARRM